jgi:hypothetical protein
VTRGPVPPGLKVTGTVVAAGAGPAFVACRRVSMGVQEPLRRRGDRRPQRAVGLGEALLCLGALAEHLDGVAARVGDCYGVSDVASRDRTDLRL